MPVPCNGHQVLDVALSNRLRPVCWLSLRYADPVLAACSLGMPWPLSAHPSSTLSMDLLSLIARFWGQCGRYVLYGHAFSASQPDLQVPPDRSNHSRGDHPCVV